MADKYTDDKLYKVVRKDGSHLNTKVNPDGTKSALQFTDDNNDLNGPVDLIEVDEEELIRTEYIQVPQNKRSLGELLVDEVFVPVIRDATTQLLEYGTAKAETWIEEKVVPVAKTKVKAGWENLKLFISTIKDSDKPIKATQIIAEQKSASNSSEIEVVNKVECGNKDEKKYVLSPGEVEILLDNLYGNVFFVSDEKSVSSESYIEMLQEPIPEQELSIESNPQALKRIEKKYIAEILKSGSSEIPKRREDQSEESYVMMRKFGLILLRDIMEERDSLVHREFSDFLTVEDECQIREKFNNSPTLPDDDINTSVDQTKKLIIAIKNGLEYPSSKNGFKYDDIIGFFNQLSQIFDWSIYEKSTLGNESKRKWYAVILSQWMEGSGLSYIMQRAIDYHKQHPENFRVSAYQPPTIYNDNSKEHRNVVFADTLEAIENIVLFSISNYFLRFSNEYKKIHGVDEFDNNWYEYVEFGTTNPLTILLQRNGFSRESATFIKTALLRNTLRISLHVSQDLLKNRLVLHQTIAIT